mmetsp:Transcript_37618/g.82046  ORF Transcript_37618/g.82046 Transcript_37618/m.82046 type:complete len:202 (+) Transcript_37618:1-606(+)
MDCVVDCVLDCVVVCMVGCVVDCVVVEPVHSPQAAQLLNWQRSTTGTKHGQLVLKQKSSQLGGLRVMITETGEVDAKETSLSRAAQVAKHEPPLTSSIKPLSTPETELVAESALSSKAEAELLRCFCIQLRPRPGRPQVAAEMDELTLLCCVSDCKSSEMHGIYSSDDAGVAAATRRRQQSFARCIHLDSILVRSRTQLLP